MVASISQIREFMRRIVSRRRPPVLNGRFDTSDILQESLLQFVQTQALVGDEDLPDVTGAYAKKVCSGHLHKQCGHHFAKRRSATHNVASEVDLPGDNEPLINEIARSEDLTRLCQALVNLDTEQRDLIQLHLAEGLSFNQIAEKWGRPTYELRRRYHESLKQLRRLMIGGTDDA